MKVLKPQALGLATRPIEFRKRFGLSISAYLHLPFAQGPNGTLWAEQSMWSFLGKEMVQPMIDEGVAKLTPEFLVHGKAWLPKDVRPGAPAACAVRARLGTCEKTLLVFGDRYWDGTRASAPQPFESMPIEWSAAYGGADFAPNPSGRGRAAQDGVTRLPNIESPQERVQRPDQAVSPTGFGAFDAMAPQRTRFRGTYDLDYLKQHAPGFAPDTDWRYFNLAPQDQWLQAPLAGDETFAFDNLHPEKPRIEGRLPGLRARVFAGYEMAGTAEPKVREVPLRLTTVWFFPHAERCIAIFQGLAEVGTDDGSDVVSLMGAVERVGQPRTDAHYLDAAAKRVDPNIGAIYSLVDSDLLPEGISTVDPDVEAAKAPFDMAGLQGEAQWRRAELDVQIARDKALASGKDPDALGIVMPVREVMPTGEALAPYLVRKVEEAQAAQWAAVEDAVTLLERAFAASDRLKIDLAEVQHRGPPRYNAEQHLAALRVQAAILTVPPDLDALLPKLVQLEATHRAGYLQSAHMQPPAFAMEAKAASALRDEMARAMPAGMRYFAGLDLTGADFSGLDLRGVDFSNAWLESANLAGANLSGADFSSAVLAHANLQGVIAVGTKFSRANLGKAQLAKAMCDDADFSDAVLMHCAFAGTQMRRANFAKANLLETTWGVADWGGALMAGQTLYKLDLRGMQWPGADLSACNIIESDLSGVDLQAALLAGTTFVTCKLDGARCAGAQCAGAVTVKECSLIGIDLSQADCTGFNFGGAMANGARLVRTRLDGANLASMRLEGADLRLGSAKGALARKAVLRHAVLAGADLSGAIFQGADLRGADMRRSNLFGADLTRVRLSGDTRFDGALLDRSRTWPRLSAEQQEAA